MWAASADEPSYPPADVGELLQAGELAAALDKGWFGDEWHYRLVRSAASTALPTISVSVAIFATI